LLSLQYSLSNILSSKYEFGLVELDSLILEIRRDSTGKMLLPPLKTGGGESESPLAVAVERLTIRQSRAAMYGVDDSTVVEELNFDGALNIDAGTVAGEIEQLAFNMPAKDFELTSASGKVTYSNDRVVFQDFVLSSGGKRARLSGSMSLKELSGQLEIAVDQLDLSELQELGAPRVNGVLDLNGRIRFDSLSLTGSVNIAGRIAFASLENLQADFTLADKRLTFDSLYGFILNDCAIDGSGWIDFSGKPEMYGLAADIRNFNLIEIAPNSFQSDLNGLIELEGSSFKGDELRLTVHTELYESEFDGYPMHVSVGDMIITSDSLIFSAPFIVRHHENTFTASGALAYSDGIEMDIIADLPRLDRYRGSFFIDDPGGRGEARASLSGKTSDPNLFGEFVSDSAWIYGIYSQQCSVHVDIDRFLTRRQGVTFVSLGTGEFYGSPYDSMAVHLTLDSHVVFVDSLETFSSTLLGYAVGSYDYGLYPAQVRVDTLSLDMFGQLVYNYGKLLVTVDSNGYSLESMSLLHGQGQMTAAGTVGTDESIDLDIVIDSLLVEPWARLLQYEMPVNGFASGEMLLRGSFANPSFIIDGRIDSLQYSDVPIGEMTVASVYEDRLISIDSLVITSDARRYHLSGFANADLSLSADSIYRIPDLPIDLQLSAHDTRFQILTNFLPSLEDLQGELNADIHLTGTPYEPHLEGDGYLRVDSLKYFDLAETIHADSVHIRMEDNRFVLDNAVAYVKPEKGRFKGEKRYATVTGHVEFQSIEKLIYDLEVSIARDHPFTYELEDIKGTVKQGRLSIKGQSPPTVSGEIVLSRMDYQVPFATTTEGSPVLAALTQGTTWDLDIEIDIPSEYWVRNEDIDAEFEGEIHLVRDAGRYSFSGQMKVVRGKGYLVDKTFQLEPGGQVVFDGSEGLNPRLNLTATSRIPGRPVEGEESAEPINLCVQVTGTLDVPLIDPCPDSEFGSEDILSLIALNSYGDQQFGVSGVMGERFSQFLGNIVSRTVTRQLGVETFQIDPAYEGQFDIAGTRVTLGKSLSRNLYAYLRTSVGFSANSEVGFEYRIIRELLLQGRRTEDEEYALNLKVHWEF
jgi:autotransporter translocation and assembly factor TamB